MGTLVKKSSEEGASALSDKAAKQVIQNKEPEMNPSVTIHASVLFKYLLLALGVLFVLHILVVLSYQLGFPFRGHTKFYFDREGNLPTYFSTLILFLSSSLLALIAALKRKANDFFAKHWTILAIIFLGLSIDEAVDFHKGLIEPLRNTFHLSGLLNFSWVIAGGIFVILLVFLS
ncbi:hypothetical protein BH24BAC1_BH24BAC1_09280 [soil metagenome]